MKIERIDPFAQTNKVLDLISVYQQAFGRHPWYEGYVCPVCKRTYGLCQEKICTTCIKQNKTVLLVEYWPFNTVVTNYYTDMSKNDSISLIALKSDDVTGFAWGFQIEINNELEALIDAKGLGRIVQGQFFYLAECAVLPDKQNKGMGRRILDRLFKIQKYDQVLLRTLQGSVMQHLIEKMGGRIIQNITQNRVIMVI